MPGSIGVTIARVACSFLFPDRSCSLIYIQPSWEGEAVALDEATRGLGLALAALFVLAVVHKLGVLRSADAAREPLIRDSAVLRRHARLAVGAAAVAEAATAGLLVVAPVYGYALALVLVTVYAARLRRLPAGQRCNCFGSVMHADRRSSAIARNMLIGGVAALVLAGYATGRLDTPPLSTSAVGLALEDSEERENRPLRELVDVHLRSALLPRRLFGDPDQPRGGVEPRDRRRDHGPLGVTVACDGARAGAAGLRSRTEAIASSVELLAG
jgi:hypothetical protein